MRNAILAALIFLIALAPADAAAQDSAKELLDQAEIPCTIKNQRSNMLGGEIPFVEVFPELWVLQDDDFERGQKLLNDWEDAKPLEATSWTCANCGEIHQKEFTTCWKCNQERT